MTCGDLADLGNRVDQAALRGHVGNRDQLRAWPDRAFECGKVELTGGIVFDDVNLDPDARFHVQKGEIVGRVLGARGDDAVAGAKRHRVERHVPGARPAFHESDFVALGANQRGNCVVHIGDAIGCLDHRLHATNGGFACQMTGHCVKLRGAATKPSRHC